MTITVPAPNDFGFDGEPPYSKEAHDGDGHGSTGTSAADVLDGWEVGQGRGVEGGHGREDRTEVSRPRQAPRRAGGLATNMADAGGFLRGRLGGGAREA